MTEVRRGEDVPTHIWPLAHQHLPHQASKRIHIRCLAECALHEELRGAMRDSPEGACDDWLSRVNHHAAQTKVCRRQGKDQGG